MVLNTHCHSDHMGGNARLRREYGAQVWVPEAEAPHIQSWDQAALWLDDAGQQAEPFRVDGLLRPGETLLLGQTEWQVLAAPGHRMEALMFYAPEFRILISGDALWQNGLGAVLPDADLAGLAAAQATLELIAALDIDWVIPGHGAPFANVAQALQTASRRLLQWRDNPQRWVLSLLKSLLLFNLLEMGSMPLVQLPDYLGRLSLLQQSSLILLQRPVAELAQQVVTELEQMRVVRRYGGRLLPLLRA